MYAFNTCMKSAVWFSAQLVCTCQTPVVSVMYATHVLQPPDQMQKDKLHVFRDHHWDIFGEDNSEETNALISDAATKAKDRFLAEISAVLSRGIRHVIAPPSAAWHHQGYLHDTASPYAHKVRGCDTIMCFAVSLRCLSCAGVECRFMGVVELLSICFALRLKLLVLCSLYVIDTVL